MRTRAVAQINFPLGKTKTRLEELGGSFSPINNSRKGKGSKTERIDIMQYGDAFNPIVSKDSIAHDAIDLASCAIYGRVGPWRGQTGNMKARRTKTHPQGTL
ncbi:MAG: hypothetical protein ALECFALPRED_004164 [Alectoria fallacina]|uniref:Uncharacterized protein n=1 Tax=Alectoria fallacina TaxID=1903189 RepID=A0A8H3FQG0_9LECA|nr:MAG: hypothetical protein ALECFALPRED_004164 [Alectoria fallacina]